MKPERIQALADKAWNDSIVAGSRQAIMDAITLAVEEALEEAASNIPMTWLDPLLLGPDAVVSARPPFTTTDIENLMRSVRQRIVAIKPQRAAEAERGEG